MTTGTEDAAGSPAEGTPAYGEDPRPDPGPAPLAPLELLRWTWRQLTSMRTALILLFLLALGAVPGSVIPQQGVDALRTANWQTQHPELTKVYEKLGLFSVYDSAWFSAIYILLMISLVGCILPRLRVYWKAMRARPPRVPRNLARLPEHRAFESSADPGAVVAEAGRALRGYRKDVDTGSGVASVSAEKGYLREAGNLLFHVSVLIVLVGFAFGSLLGYKGGVIVVAGDGFGNTLSQYDDFDPGGLFQPDRLKPFFFTVKDFDVTFIREGREAGMAHKFSAGLDYQASPTSPEKQTRISVNHPLKIDGTKVYLIGHGYAPHVTVRDADGTVAYSGSVVFLPEDSTFRSLGVIKVPEAAKAQLGFEGEFYPTYAFTMGTGPFSAFPDAQNPALSMNVWSGDLGLDSGVPQSVYALDKKGLKPVEKANGQQYRVDLALGQTKNLPDGMGSITFDRVDRFVKLQVSHNPGSWVALAGVVLALLGLLGSLFIRPRRIWVTARRDGDRTLVEVGGLDRSAGGDLAGELDALVQQLEEKA
ncbi:cytochrome c biogenesis protein ResB [Marmoricola sp. RAF53]|uniref:cytochrome c biogenesis protein ResB n=1 Tax=Marmoricola sp. RAF53 TaxID=3233059 RepID=UPI003F94EC34